MDQTPKTGHHMCQWEQTEPLNPPRLHIAGPPVELGRCEAAGISAIMTWRGLDFALPKQSSGDGENSQAAQAKWIDTMK